MKKSIRRKTILKEAGVFLAVTLLLLSTIMTVAGADTTPPVTTCTLNGDYTGGIYFSNVTVTLNATDYESGVNYTKYKLDDGAWMTYTTPFIVRHTLFIITLLIW